MIRSASADSGSSCSSHLQSSSSSAELPIANHDEGDELLDEIMERFSWAKLTIELPPVVKDDEEALWSEDGMTLLAANEAGLVNHLTSSIGNEPFTTLDYTFMDDFFLVYTCFMRPLKLATQLGARLKKAFADGDEHGKVRCFVAIRHWLRHYQIDPEATECLLNCVSVIWQEQARINMPDSQMLIHLQEQLGRGGGHKRNASLESQASGVPTLQSQSPSTSYSREGGLKSLLKRWFKSDAASFDSTPSLSNLSDLTAESTPDPLVMLDARRRGRWLLSESSEMVAQALCMLEAKWLMECRWQDLLDYPKHVHPSVQMQVDRFNSHTHQWVEEVTRSNDFKEQHAILLKWIRIAAKCLEHGNFNSAMKLILALQNSEVQACRLAWQRFGPRDLRLYDALVEWASPTRNFGRLRQSLDDCEARQVPCIPLFGLFLSDLSMNEVIRSDLPGPADHLIPWYRWSMVAKLVHRFQRIQSLAAGYNFIMRDELLESLDKL